MFGIIGSGFGLYGYLPALMNLSLKVALLSKAKKIVQNRDDIKIYYDKIIWIDNIEDLLASCENIIISVPPFRQYELVKDLTLYSNIRNIIIEKPVADSPVKSKEIINLLNKTGINYRIAYLLLYTDWYNDLYGRISNKNSLDYVVNIKWCFKANHFKYKLENWKKDHYLGGGVIRFYGIHIIALLSNMNFSNVIDSVLSGDNENIFVKWTSQFSSKDNKTSAFVKIDTDSDIENFEISIYNKLIDKIDFSIKLSNPFEKYNCAKQDVRSIFIERLIIDLIDKKPERITSNSINDLWQAIELKTLNSFNIR